MSASLRRQTLADLLRRTALRLPHKPGIVCGDTRWTWHEFDAVVSRLAAGLQAAGVAVGERVAVLARNSHGFAALRFALARIGAVMVPVNFMLNADEAAYILRHAGAKLLAVDSGLAALGRAAAAKDTQVARLLWLPSEQPSEPIADALNFHTLAACTAAVKEPFVMGEGSGVITVPRRRRSVSGSSDQGQGHLYVALITPAGPPKRRTARSTAGGARERRAPATRAAGRGRSPPDRLTAARPGHGSPVKTTKPPA